MFLVHNLKVVARALQLPDGHVLLVQPEDVVKRHRYLVAQVLPEEGRRQAEPVRPGGAEQLPLGLGLLPPGAH